jgi:hypothetical protein
MLTEDAVIGWHCEHRRTTENPSFSSSQSGGFVPHSPPGRTSCRTADKYSNAGGGERT